MHLLKKGDFSRFVESLISQHDVIAPVKQDIVRFKLLEKGDGSAGRVVFDNPLYPAKDFFLPLKEPFFHFRKGHVNEDTGLGKNSKESRKTVFLMNRCDINAVHRNDLILLEEPADPYYREKRENAVLVEIPCVKLERCTCEDIGLIDCYDLKIIDPGEEGDSNNYIVNAATQKGKELIKNLHLPETELKKEPLPEYKPKDIKTDNKKIWEKYGKECLSCSACTAVCPTCTCFTIEGHMELNCEEGYRYRQWSSCQLLEYTRVAGGFVFRKDRELRGKQRLHCKFQYFREKFGHNRCIGCGRCNEACPVGINIYEYHKKLK